MRAEYKHCQTKQPTPNTASPRAGSGTGGAKTNKRNAGTVTQNNAQTLKSKALEQLNAGKLPQALKKAQLGIKKFPKDPDYQAIAGFVLTEMQKHKQSIPHFVEASRMKPNDPQFAENIANALMHTGQVPRALSYAEQKLKEFPNNAELLRVVDEIEFKTNNWREIIKHASERLAREPDNATALLARSRAYAQIGFAEQSERDILRGYEISPEDVDVAFGKAVYLHEAGRMHECTRMFWKILDQDDSHGHTLMRLADLAAPADFPSLIEKVDRASTLGREEPAVLQFAKARLVSRHDGLEAAMPHFAKANAAHLAGGTYDEKTEEQKYDRIRDIFPLTAPTPATAKSEQPTPIFIVGQPRSGTTLLEMMLSTAPEITGCGELPLGEELAQPYINGERSFDQEAAERFASEFRALMPPLAEGATAFIDKMPHNYQRIGFLLSAFPNAKVLNILRDPRDVGLSKWQIMFRAPGMKYSADLKSIAHSANLYRKYISHWEHLIGDRMLTVQYETLVGDAEPQSRKIACFCGIEWNNRMMQPEKNPKSARTASIDQVRRKISTSAIGKWRTVANHIKPMLDGLDPDLWPEYDIE